MTAAAELVGHTLADRYDVLELLGAGGMGAVYRAHDHELGELVALKVIHTALAGNAAMIDRFRHEVKLARRVTHRNVARTFELVHVHGLMFCTMELVEGDSLRHRLVRGPRLTIAEAAHVAREVCAGLAAAHEVGVIHRDIKPDNILLAADGRVVVADFGVAAITSVQGLDEMSGTPAYMALEQARGEAPVPASDVYAIGVVLFEMLVNHRAFTGSTQHVLAAKQELDALPLDELPRELATIVGRATARDRIDRTASVAELGRSLAPWAEGGALAAAVPRETAPAMHDIVVVAPTGDATRLHLAEGVCDALLQRLAVRPGVRVLSRVEPGSPVNATSIELVVGDQLAVTIHRGHTTRTLALPLEIAELELAADAIASAVVDGIDRPTPSERTNEANELRLRARVVGRRGLESTRDALALIERAHHLAPEDPRIAAARALATVRDATIGGPVEIAHGAELVRVALAVAPDLAESHVAAGHLELHTGDAARSARHFRTAIACSRYVADGHDGLGRLLLEAGFLVEGMARLDDALAIAPRLSSVRWEIVRAYALEQRWDVYDAMSQQLAELGDRAITRLRLAWWRGDRATLVALRDRSPIHVDPQMAAMLLDVALDQAWPQHRQALVAQVLRGRPRVKRREAFLAQLVAEVACASGDLATGVQMLDRAVDHGLFDLHWLDRCPLLESLRATPELARIRTRVKHRADAILDALYGDLDQPDTVVL